MNIANIFHTLILIGFLIPDSIYSQKTLNPEEALRIDFVLAGNSEQQTATIVNYLKTPNFNANPDQVLPDFDYGSYRVLLLNKKSNDTLFLKGFCTLFEEWQTTAEAQKKERAFKQTVETPWPNTNVIVKLEWRNSTGKFQPLLTEQFSPSKNITRLVPKSFPDSIIHGKNNPSSQLDLLILAEGYSQSEAASFFEDAHRLSSELLNTEPYDRLKEKITIRALAVISEESGTDDPRKEIWKNTAMNSSFNTFGTDRYLESMATWKIFDYAASFPRDHIIVLVNSEKYGGGGVYNHFSITSSNHHESAKVMIHELGHGLAGLGDEYYSPAVSYSDFFDLETEPWHPNITTLVNFGSKWKKLIDSSIPVPTPAKSKYENVTGLFEGAGYSAKGIFRPAMNCRMKSNEAEGFCEVCNLSIEKTVNFYSK
jgi:hypothetical protein